MENKLKFGDKKSINKKKEYETECDVHTEEIESFKHIEIYPEAGNKNPRCICKTGKICNKLNFCRKVKKVVIFWER